MIAQAEHGGADVGNRLVFVVLAIFMQVSVDKVHPVLRPLQVDVFQRLHFVETTDLAITHVRQSHV